MFNGLALIDISDIGDIDYLDSHIVDANTIFLLTHDDADAGADFDADETQHLWKTTDGGSTWQRVWFHLSTGTEGMAILAVSPDFANDQTLFIAQDDTRIWKSTDGGGRFIGLAAPAAVTAITAIGEDDYFTGHANSRIYRNGHWNYGTAADTVTSIVLSPNFAEDDTVIVGNNDGDVYVSVNASATASVLYSRQGIAEELGDTATIIAVPHPSYADNSTIFAVSTDATTIGIMRWVKGTSATWAEIDGTNTSGNTYANSLGNGLALSADGSLYAAIGVANQGIRRTTAPTSATVAGRDMESMTTNLPTGAILQNLAYIPGSNNLYAIASGCPTSNTSYPHGWQLVAISDTFAITPVMTAPAEGAEVGTSVQLSWEAIPAPSGTTVTYNYEVSYDSAYANDVADASGTTYGTWVTVTMPTRGKTYYWRVYVDDGNPLKTRYATGTFVVTLGAATQSSSLSAPAPGATGISLSPIFQWEPVASSTGYRVELSTTADFGTTLASKLLDTTVWASGAALEYGTTYYWRVKAVSADTESAWSVGAFTTMVKPAAPAPAVTVPPAQPAPTITVDVPPAQTITVPAATTITPSWIYAIIIIGAVLVIAVIVLIVRTRRVV